MKLFTPCSDAVRDAYLCCSVKLLAIQFSVSLLLYATFYHHLQFPKEEEITLRPARALEPIFTASLAIQELELFEILRNEFDHFDGGGSGMEATTV